MSGQKLCISLHRVKHYLYIEFLCSTCFEQQEYLKSQEQINSRKKELRTARFAISTLIWFITTAQQNIDNQKTQWAKQAYFFFH